MEQHGGEGGEEERETGHLPPMALGLPANKGGLSCSQLVRPVSPPALLAELPLIPAVTSRATRARISSCLPSAALVGHFLARHFDSLGPAALVQLEDHVPKRVYVPMLSLKLKRIRDVSGRYR